MTFKKTILLAMALLLISFPAFAIDVDLDSNDLMDAAFGGTNANSGAWTGIAYVDAGVWEAIVNPTFTDDWTFSGTTTLADIVIGPMNITANSGEIELVDMANTGAAGTKQGYIFKLGNVFIAEPFALADGSNGVKAPGFLNTKVELYPAILTDTTTPHALTVSECSDTVISIETLGADVEFDLPDISAYDGSLGRLKVKFENKLTQGTYDIYIDPDASTQIALDGTISGADGNYITMQTPSDWSAVNCESTFTSALGGVWNCITIAGTITPE